MTTVALALSLAINLVLGLLVIRARRRIKHLACVETVNQQLAHELERKLGERKALRLIKSTANSIGQREVRRAAGINPSA